MTRLERRIHGLIEKAIRKGYVLTLTEGRDQCRSWFSEDSQSCCVVGAIGVGAGASRSYSHEIAHVSGISMEKLEEIERGFECGHSYTPLQALGASLRERYVVQG